MIHGEVERHFAKQPGTSFAHGFDPLYPWTLYHLLFAYGDQPANTRLARCEDWQFLVPVVLDGMRHAASIMVPAALCAFFEELPMPGVAAPEVGFRDNMVRDFFGERAREFYSLAAQYDLGSSPLKDNTLKQLTLAVNAAKNKVAV